MMILTPRVAMAALVPNTMRTGMIPRPVQVVGVEWEGRHPPDDDGVVCEVR